VNERHGRGGEEESPSTEAADAAERLLLRVTTKLPHGEVRSQQVEMCRAVASAIDEERNLVVQAGTGTGKSLAYLIPSSAANKRVVVATATKALQDQLATKDLPLVAASIGEGFRFAVLKGRSNYLCRQRALEVGGGGFQQELVIPEPILDTEDPDASGAESVEDKSGTPEPGGLVDQVRRLLAWADVTDSGDRADLAFEPHPRAWAMLSVGPRECPGRYRCPSGDDCFAERARDAAEAADVVVVNTHLYGAHLASGGMVLPPHDVVVFDEAHELEEVMTSSLGVELTAGRLRALVALARPVVTGDDAPGILNDLSDIADRLGQELDERRGQRVLFDGGPDSGEGPPPDETSQLPAGEPTERARVRSPFERRTGRSPEFDAPDRRLTDLLALASNRVTNLVRRMVASDGDASGPEQAARRARAQNAAGHIAEDLNRLVGRTDDEVVWVDGNPRSPILRLSPIDVGPPLAGTLWGAVTAILTSATIPARLAARVGLEAFGVDELDVGSPFDYRGHSLLYVARHLPDRRDPRSEPQLHEELEALIRAAGGRTLALFTSHRATAAAVAALRPRLTPRLLVQGELPKARLLEQFASDETSCLFATLGFWQGVDVPGRALVLVTLDRLPFARPDDPLMQARRDRAGEQAFRLVDLPRAATLLAQGAGRLIRSAQDRGVVAVLDPRLATAGYRAALLAGVPPMRRTTDRRQVEQFLAEVVSGQ
jgi:ATP-dependent DNA helicase DinG